MSKPTIGARELALLRHVAAHAQASAGDVATGFGADHDLARSTVVTMMERLRVKGYLKRRKLRGVYHYELARAPGDVMRGAVNRFVETTLGGSTAPLVAWMAERRSVSAEELAELEALVARLKAQHEES